MENKDKLNIYARCKLTPRQKFRNELSEEGRKRIGKSFDIPPLYENDMFERAFIEHYSLATNKNLGCRWREYRQNIGTKVFAPFQLPDVKQEHFQNCAVRYIPRDSTTHRDNRKKLKPGPGVDYGGQMPIPQEALMKRDLTVKKAERKKKASNEKVVKHAKMMGKAQMKKKM